MDVFGVGHWCCSFYCVILLRKREADVHYFYFRGFLAHHSLVETLVSVACCHVVDCLSLLLLDVVAVMPQTVLGDLFILLSLVYDESRNACNRRDVFAVYVFLLEEIWDHLLVD